MFLKPLSTPSMSKAISVTVRSLGVNDVTLGWSICPSLTWR
ncbi:exported protein of unknown function [Microbacterium sp. Nx66]|nr:exported protein of unknown function [Microbacterium sp. Nx66]